MLSYSFSHSYGAQLLAEIIPLVFEYIDYSSESLYEA